MIFYPEEVCGRVLFELSPKAESVKASRELFESCDELKDALASPAVEIKEKEKVIEKYKGMAKDNKVFPMPSNTTCNKKLKAIADLCGIKTHLTYHVARHSAATTILLSNGVPIETVSRLLGHTNIKTTQIYAKITAQKISQDLELLSDKLGDMEKSICSAI